MAMELLAPVGGMEQLRAAVLFGADAVYLAGKHFGMRARAANFSNEQIAEAVQFAHAHGVKVHVTCNILMDQADLDQLPPYLEALDAAGVDALIISDLGAWRLARQYAPHCELHVSTQAGVANALTALTWYELGAKRVVCAREMSLEDIRIMRAQVPDDLEIEVFAHGAMCVAVSGRCLISSFLTGRSGNKGNCAQSCRWNFSLQEERRPGEFYPIGEDENGSFILNARDMNMLAYLKELEEAGVNSIKIEGRNKKAFYVATVINAYRQVLDGADPEVLGAELFGISHRPYSTGFYFGEPGQSTEVDGYTQESVHVADILSCEEIPAGAVREGASQGVVPQGAEAPEAAAKDAAPQEAAPRYHVTVRCRNRFSLDDPLEALVPRVPPVPVSVENLHWIAQPEDASFLEKRLVTEDRRIARDSRVEAGLAMTTDVRWKEQSDDAPEEEALDFDDVRAFVSAVQAGETPPCSIGVSCAVRSKMLYEFDSPVFLQPGGFIRVRRFRQACSVK